MNGEDAWATFVRKLMVVLRVEGGGLPLKLSAIASWSLCEMIELGTNKSGSGSRLTRFSNIRVDSLHGYPLITAMFLLTGKFGDFCNIKGRRPLQESVARIMCRGVTTKTQSGFAEASSNRRPCDSR